LAYWLLPKGLRWAGHLGPQSHGFRVALMLGLAATYKPPIRLGCFAFQVRTGRQGHVSSFNHCQDGGRWLSSFLDRSMAFSGCHQFLCPSPLPGHLSPGTSSHSAGANAEPPLGQGDYRLTDCAGTLGLRAALGRAQNCLAKPLGVGSLHLAMDSGRAILCFLSLPVFLHRKDFTPGSERGMDSSRPSQGQVLLLVGTRRVTLDDEKKKVSWSSE
jgi:hypothetical protein